MKSIGFFWKSYQDEDDFCQKCPYGKDKIVSSNEVSSSKNNDFEFQINLWNTNVSNIVDKHQFRFRAIDFGVVCPLSTRKLYFLFPFKVDKTDFQDLVKCLSLDANLLCTVFNENLKSTSEPAKSYHKIDGGNVHLLMYELSKENIETFNYDAAANVTEMAVTINTNFATEEFKDYKLFVRFRLMLESFDSFAKKKKVSNDWLQSAFSSTYLFDIRLNDVRELAKKKKELVEFKGFLLPEFKKVHFFYMADSEENVENGSSMKLDKRLLENERWHSYLGGNLEFVSANIAHHWKSVSRYIVGLKKAEVTDSQNSKLELDPKETKISNFTLFFKTEFSDCQFKRLLLYISIIVVLGMIASAIISIISCFIPDNFGYVWAVWSILIISLTLLVFFILYKSTKK